MWVKKLLTLVSVLVGFSLPLCASELVDSIDKLELTLQNVKDLEVKQKEKINDLENHCQELQKQVQESLTIQENLENLTIEQSNQLTIVSSKLETSEKKLSFWKRIAIGSGGCSMILVLILIL